jgi:putative oxidoreductase
MNEVVSKYGPVIGRCMIALIFLISGVGKITGFQGTAAYMASKGLPMIEVLLVLTIVIEIGAALMLIVGWKARSGATAILLWMIPVTLVFHNFWAMPAGQEQYINQIMFLKNVAMMGAMLYIMVFGPGGYSVDKK